MHTSSDELLLSTSFMRHVNPFLQFVAETFEVSAADLQEAVKGLEEFQELVCMTPILTASTLPGRISWKIKPLLNGRPPNKHLVNGILIEFSVEGRHIVDMAFQEDEIAVRGQDFFLSSKQGMLSESTCSDQTFASLTHAQRFFLYQVIRHFPCTHGTTLFRLKMMLVDMLKPQNIYSQKFAPGLEIPIERALHVLDIYQASQRGHDPRYVAGWQHDLSLLSGAPTAEVLIKMLADDTSSFEVACHLDMRKQRIAAVTFGVTVFDGVVFHLCVSQHGVDVDLHFARVGTVLPSFLAVEQLGEVLAGLPRDKQEYLCATAKTLLRAAEALVGTVPESEAIRRTSMLLLALEPQLQYCH